MTGIVRGGLEEVVGKRWKGMDWRMRHRGQALLYFGAEMASQKPLQKSKT
jgi:hypothetical protein